MTGFFACPPDAWAIAAEALPKPWPEVCAATDLRWWVDQIGGGKARALPTERELCARWGWGNRRVRTLLHAVEGWADPLRLEASRAALEAALDRAPPHERSRTAAAAQQDRSSAWRANAENLDAAQQDRSSSAAGPQHSRAELRAGSPSTLSHPEGGGARATLTDLDPTVEPTGISGTGSPPPVAVPVAGVDASPPERGGTPPARVGGYGRGPNLAAGEVPFVPPDEPGAEPVRLPDGREVPGDLPTLLGGNQRAISKLLAAGVETTRALLSLTFDELRMSTGGAGMAAGVRDTLARHQPGVELGCLAAPPSPTHTSPPTPTAIEGGRPTKKIRPLDWSPPEASHG